jgi:hypothetical protein
VPRFVDTNLLLHSVLTDGDAKHEVAVRNALATRKRFAISYWMPASSRQRARQAAPRCCPKDLGDGQDYGGVVVRNPFGSA